MERLALIFLMFGLSGAVASAEPVQRWGADQDRAGRTPRAADPPSIHRPPVRVTPKKKVSPRAEPYLKAAPQYGDPGKAIDRIPET